MEEPAGLVQADPEACVHARGLGQLCRSLLPQVVCQCVVQKVCDEIWMWPACPLKERPDEIDPDLKASNIAIPLQNNMGWIRRRGQRAVLRYYFDKKREEEMKRNLLLLFLPFNNEVKDIHEKDIDKLYEINFEQIEEKRIGEKRRE